MRSILNINQNWAFLKDAKEVPATLPADWEVVNVPHSWNNIDGMDGGADYFRGTCHYAKVIKKDALIEAERWFSLASELHFELEKIYGEAMDFKKNDEILDVKLQEIKNILQI